MRRSFEGYPVSPMQPQAAYYVTRNLAAVLDDLKPALFKVDTEEKPNLEIRTLEKADEKVVAVWFAGIPKDEHEGIPLKLTIHSPARRISAYNCMTGEETELVFKIEKDTVIVTDVLVRDFPLLIKITIDCSS
jgi:hypothetical protein